MGAAARSRRALRHQAKSWVTHKRPLRRTTPTPTRRYCLLRMFRRWLELFINAAWIFLRVSPTPTFSALADVPLARLHVRHEWNRRPDSAIRELCRCARFDRADESLRPYIPWEARAWLTIEWPWRSEDVVATAVPEASAVLSASSAHSASTVILHRDGGLGGRAFPNKASFVSEAPERRPRAPAGTI